MSIDKTEPYKLPFWVRLCNLPLEAWSFNGISTLASRIGKPLIMDAITASMCKHKTRRIGYARVLVEVRAKKGLLENVDVMYQNALNEKIGHKIYKCKKDAKEHNVINAGNEGYSNKQGKNDDGKVQSKKAGKQNVVNQTKPTNQFKSAAWNGVIGEKTKHQDHFKNGSNGDKMKKTGQKGINQYNKFDVPNEFKECELNEPEGMLDREQVDVFISIELKIGIWNIIGMGSSFKQDEIINLIRDEKLNVCVILETHLKSKHLEKVCGEVYGSQNWFSNMRVSDKGCRIIVGQDVNCVNVVNVNISKQVILCMMESTDNHMISFMSRVYAANGGVKRIYL
nr:hypothetical protein [Tanacetum cinerariifolium]